MMWWTWGVSFSFSDIRVERNKTGRGLIFLICCILYNIHFLKQASFCISHINSIKVLKRFQPDQIEHVNLTSAMSVLRHSHLFGCWDGFSDWMNIWCIHNVDLINHLLCFVCDHFTRNFPTRILCSQLTYWPLRTQYTILSSFWPQHSSSSNETDRSSSFCQYWRFYYFSNFLNCIWNRNIHCFLK